MDKYIPVGHSKQFNTPGVKTESCVAIRQCEPYHTHPTEKLQVCLSTEQNDSRNLKIFDARPQLVQIIHQRLHIKYSILFYVLFQYLGIWYLQAAIFWYGAGHGGIDVAVGNINTCGTPALLQACCCFPTFCLFNNSWFLES